MLLLLYLQLKVSQLTSSSTKAARVFSPHLRPSKGTGVTSSTLVLEPDLPQTLVMRWLMQLYGSSPAANPMEPQTPLLPDTTLTVATLML